MKIITTIKELQSELAIQKKSGKTVGFVPTMGYLHEGHLTLIKHARHENDLVVLSIFVNPIQFGPKEDLSTYPRDFERDRALAECENVDYLFYPSVEEMYPNKITVQAAVQQRTDVLCGKSRPGHFDGVATVITKLFNIVMPTKAYFGKKDAQQVAVIDGVIADFNFPIELVAVDTVRESDGLAKSSRNVNLQPEERKQAPVLFKSLKAAKAAINQGERNPDNIVSAIKEMISKESNGYIDYVEIYSYPELQPVERISGRVIIALAVKFTKVRLIDNLVINLDLEED
ncbi:pantoate--beta-alanine ligase [Neobacillus kokaensis]|uniref:Pantothenate synthetase n=1 Tax=Neobacillus kokaensis TaxID=2759023 RepID=A0ABQ3MZU8_9BACI|nr:pantoate--beta-alanine ligase [Neobacillus kokaensis]GHH98210.1 pantothenate synthetase [Neobacillus kokaensis]